MHLRQDAEDAKGAKMTQSTQKKTLKDVHLSPVFFSALCVFLRPLRPVKSAFDLRLR